MASCLDVPYAPSGLVHGLHLAYGMEGASHGTEALPPLDRASHRENQEGGRGASQGAWGEGGHLEV